MRTVLPEPLSPLSDLALNLRWSWHEPTLALFRDLDPPRWEAVRRDPVAMLSAVPPARFEELAGDDGYVTRVREAGEELRRYLTEPRWFQRQQQAGATLPAGVAYFSPEFGITAALPQYSGGLGILAGDHLKSASDLGLPLVGVGLFYKSGYFRQQLDADGWQQESYPVLDPDGLPLSLLREADGTPCVVSLAMPGGGRLDARVWRAQVGRVPLLLLDSDVETNDAPRRSLTDRLYGGGGDQRLQQEMLLGIGGVRALRTWSRITGAPAPEVFHTNEGHAGFLGVERISELVTGAGLTFDEALQAVRAGTVFTTHTPVPAGIDRFGTEQVRLHFSGAAELPGVPVDSLLALGAESYEGGDHSVFNMAVMGLRLAQRANGVSRLHGQVSREMFCGLWPGFDAQEVPISSVTNGVHAPTWVDPALRDLVGEAAEGFDGAAFWATKRELRAQLVADARARLRRSMRRRGAVEPELAWVEEALDPDVLTIGFARRVPTYKRLTLMLRDPERLARLLLDPERPVQLVIAGKSHPADDTGKRLIQELVRFTDDPRVRHRIVFLPNYDIGMAQRLYPGCDVWLNNPLRPFEACGTSGMKAALNGALNLSVLDGWWDEWFDGRNGWAIPTADGVDDPERRDDLEAGALYDLLEDAVVPAYYDHDERGLPQRWLAMVGHTLATLGPKVLSDRMVREYVEELYAPAGRSAGWVAQDSFRGARDLAGYADRVGHSWPHVAVDHVEAEGIGDTPQVGDTVRVRAFLALDGLDPQDVAAEVVIGRASNGDELADTESVPLRHVEAYEAGRHRFEAELPLRRTGSLGWTVRVLPRHAGLATPAELGLVALA